MSTTGILNCDNGKALLNCNTGKALLHCRDIIYATACVAHFRGGNGGPTGDWEYGLGASTSNIAVNANVVWPNNFFVTWELSYSGPGGTLTLTVNGVAINWTPGTAIPSDDKRWKLLLELYATSDRTHQIATENVALSIDATDYPLDDMLVTSGNSAAASTQPHRLGNQVWIVTGSVGLGWTGTYPNASRLQAILRLQRET